MPVDLFSGKASVQTAIYLFEAGKPHNQDNLVTFVDFSEDGYTRMNRRKSGQDVNLRDTDDAKGRYAELVARILNKKTSTAYFTEANGKLIRDTISLTGKDWTFSQHAKPDTEPTLEDFRKTVKNYLSWKLSEIIQKESNSLGKEVEILNKPCSWRDFPLTSLFEIANTESILKSQILPSEIGIPYLTAKEGDNSIASYAVEDNNLRKDKGHCVFIGGKTLVVSFQESDFYSNDSHNLTLHLKERKDSLKEDLGLFLAGAVYKSLKPKYSWGNSISFKKIQKDTVSLPVKDNGSPDWDYMEAFIRAIKELIVTEVVKTLNKVSKPLNR